MSGEAHILVVDDEKSVRESMSAYLEDSGYRVSQADDGAKGLQFFIDHKPDLIICDLRMPKMDGLELLQRIMELDVNTPCIVVSGAGVMADVVSALRLGASDYIVKPVSDLAVVEHAVERSLERVKLIHDNENYRTQLEAANLQLQNSLETLEADMRAGRHVQQRMFPAAPLRRLGFHCSHFVKPSLFLSGDFVDYFMIGEGHICSYIVDVAGHGVSSGMVTMLLRNEVNRLRAEYRYGASKTILSPAKVLQHLDAELRASEMGKHATAFFFIIDQEKQVVTWSSAAQYPYPVVSVDDACQTLATESPPLALLPDVEFKEHKLQYEHSFSLSICSDGLFEIMPGKSMVEKESEWQMKVCEFKHNLAELVEQFELNEVTQAPDDITLLGIEAQV